MGRVLKPLLLGALALGMAFTGTLALGAVGILNVTSAGVLGFLSTFGTGTILASVAGAVMGGISYLTPTRSTLAPFDPKQINMEAASPRKLVFGRTLMALDLRYVEPSGSNQEYIDYVFALAAHKSDAVESIYIDEDLAWTVGGGAQGKYVGYLEIEVILEAGSGAYHTVNAGTTWGASQRLTGCTSMKVRIKRSDNNKKSQSPFGSGISGRWSVIGRGIPVYDPALDSTVAGGSGSQRATDQSTWAYTASIARGNNPALQLLAYLLGWKIGGVVSVGVGLPVDTIDLPGFAAAAALCDESVALAAGGSQRRYEAGRAFTDADDPFAVIQELLKAMNGELTDDGGRLSLRVSVNDLTPIVTLTDDDFVGGYQWQPQPSIASQYTVVRGRFAQPDAPSLFGMMDYPEVAIPRTSQAPRALSLELTAVQDQRRAERIAKQAAQRSLYQGTFTVTLGIRGWLLRRNMVVAVTSNARNWTAKLFRVRALTFNEDATVEVVLREEDASIYAWDADESALVTPVGPVVFDKRFLPSWLLAGIEAGATVNEDGGGNLVTAPADSATWTYIAGGQFSDAVASTLNGRAGQMQAPGDGIIWGDLFPVTPGEVLYLRQVATCDASVPSSGSVSGGFNYFDRNRTLLSPPDDAENADGADISSAQAFNVAFRAEGKATTPAGAAFARAYTIRSGGTGGSFYTNQVRVGRDAVGADVTRDVAVTQPRGTWASGVVYRIGDLVNDANATWIANVNHTSSSGNRPATGATWSVFAPGAAAGVQGSSAAAYVETTVSSASYGSAVAAFTIEAGAGGVVDLVADLAAEAAFDNNVGGSRGAVKWQIEGPPTTWTDVAAKCNPI